MNKIGLVLEGGGMRGVFTSGILEFFTEKNFFLPYVIGTSAGAGNALNYISRQKERSKNVNIIALGKYHYIGLKPILKKRSIMDMDLIFEDFPEKLYPYDFETFSNAPQRCVITATNCNTGKAEYFEEKKDKKRLMLITRASCSLPFITPITFLEGTPYLDGGITDSIPIKRAIIDGFDRNIVVLTRPKGYRKELPRSKYIYNKFYKKYPALQDATYQRNRIYNETMDYVEDMEAQKKVLVLRPENTFGVSRMEKNTNKLMEFYKYGYKIAENNYNRLLEWIAK